MVNNVSLNSSKILSSLGKKKEIKFYNIPFSLLFGIIQTSILKP